MSIVEIKVPDIGGHENVDIIAVEVKVGDTVAVDDTLITLETDKATMDVPCTAAGVVKAVLVKVGDKVSEGAPIIEVETAGSAAAAPAPVAESGLCQVRRSGSERVEPNQENFRPKPVAQLGDDSARYRKRRSGHDRFGRIPQTVEQGMGTRRRKTVAVGLYHQGFRQRAETIPRIQFVFGRR